MVGPTLILFHCNFKVGGLVAISFWSMVVSALSGVIGRYFYVQIIKKIGTLQAEVDKYNERLDKLKASSQKEIRMEAFNLMKKRALSMAGGAALVEERPLGLIGTILVSMWGDFKMMFLSPKILKGMPGSTGLTLKNYALAKRRTFFLGAFQSLMGYWSTLHKPFAIFMYIVAVIHIIVALMFQVEH